jgi:cytochrome P450
MTMANRYPPGPFNFNAWIGLTWRHAFRLCLNPLPFIEELACKYGDLVFYRIFWYRVYQVNHPDLIREVLVTKAKSFLKEPRQMSFIRRAAGDGIITTEGEQWLWRRRLLLPVFQSRYAERMTAVAREETGQMLDVWSGLDEVPVHHELTNLILRISGRAMFGLDLREHADCLGEAFGTLSETVTHEMNSPWNLPVGFPPLTIVENVKPRT